MTEVLHTPSPSSPHSISTSSNPPALFNQNRSYVVEIEEVVEEEAEEEEVREKRDNDRTDQLSLLALLITIFRKSCRMACSSVGGDFPGGGGVMEISWPSGVEHVNHVTFDRFDGFLGLPLEFEPEVLRRAPSASATVFGVSTESMQLSYDSRGNSIPTILLLMQRHLYSRGGLQAEGIFRITAGNSQEEFVRERLNGGMVPEGTDVHCLAGLIKAWFRELPRGLLDSLTPEQVMQCQSEDECEALVRLLPSTEASLLNWAINLMADVVQNQNFNKMNAHNIAMVFAPNMTQMADPLTALMHAVQVMNFLKTLIEKTLREREEVVVGSTSVLDMEPSDDNGNQSSWRPYQQNRSGPDEETMQYNFVLEDPDTDNISDEDYHSYSTCSEESDENRSCVTSPPQAVYRVVTSSTDRLQNREFDEKKMKGKIGRPSDFHMKIDMKQQSKGRSNVSRINSTTEWF